MIPVKLTLQGIYSYRKRQVVDFENLTNAGLFGLFGSVGSGKSTIIEAISFALYGETERLNAKEGRNYNMMNLKSDELLIDFEFKMGVDQHYRFVVKGRRNVKKFDDVKTFERHAYRLNGLDWLPLESTSAEAITGLSYKNFHRTIIIPQGQFMEFLQLGASERTKMLQELFGLEKFELSGRVADLQSRNNAELQHLKGQLQSVGEVNPEQIATLEKALGGYQAELAQQSVASVSLSKTLEEMNRLKEIHQKIDNQNILLNKLQADESEVVAQEKEVVEFERIAGTFKSNVEKLTSLEQSQQRYGNEMDETKKSFVAIEESLTILKPQLEEYRELYQNKESLIQKANDLGKILDIRGLGVKCQTSINRVTSLKAEMAQRDESVVGLRKVLDDSRMQVDVLAHSIPDRDALMAVKEWFTYLNNFQSAINESEKKVLQLNTELASTASKLQQLPAEKGIELIAGVQTAQHQLNEMKLGLETSLAESRKQLLELEVQNKLQDFANTLHDGKPCPLCGSLEHPHVLNAQDVSQHAVEVKSKVEALQGRLKFIGEVEKEMAQLEIQVQSLNRQFLSEMQILNEKSRVLMEHQQKFIWKDYSPKNEQLVIDAISRVQKLSLQLEKLNQNVNLLQRQLETADAERLKVQKAIDEDEKLFFANDSQMKLLISQLSVIGLSETEHLSNDEINRQTEVLRSQYNDVVKQYEEGLKKEQELLNQKALLSGKLEWLSNTIQTITQDLAKVNDQISSDLALFDGVSLTYVMAVLAKKMDVNSIKARIQNWRKEMDVSQCLIRQYTSELEGRRFDEASFNQASAQMQLVTSKIAELNQVIGKTQTDIQRLKSDVEKWHAIQKQIEVLELRAADLSVMKSLFNASGFVNYVSTVHLQNLCKVANERFFKLTRQQLTLELDGNNSFQVRDFMNEGRVRSVKTLSGGQTFQASLSLALALADSIQHLNSSHENFFFLDEGFGTLDKESLLIVFETLKALRKENRIVGVISHVEEMQQEIETYLKVVNKEDTGSLIFESWSQ